MNNHNQPHRPKLPPWIRVKVAGGGGREEVSGILADLKLHTVCTDAQCPNLNECWHRRTATFMIMGNRCTRDCKFCAVDHAVPLPPEADEPERVAAAAVRMRLKYVVITCVTRDDLDDGGAAHFAAVVKAVRRALPEAGIEVLTSDFNCDPEAVKTVLAAGPNVFNHNIETVRRLAAEIRSRATYEKSLLVLRMAAAGSGIPVKSGLMVGLGETDGEVTETIDDLYAAGVRILTVGQYLPPSAAHWPLARYVIPEKFDEWKQLALDKGFTFVASGPLVRSSYNAAELAAGKI